MENYSVFYPHEIRSNIHILTFELSNVDHYVVCLLIDCWALINIIISNEYCTPRV